MPDGRGGWRGGVFSPIIDRNTPIPVSRVEWYNSLQDNQREVVFNIYQGESRLVSGNVKLGSIAVPIPRGPAGQQVECRFSYDTSGLLEVDVHVPATGATRNLVIVDEEGSPPADIEARRAALAALKHHPRDDAANTALMARAARCHESFVGDRRALIGPWIAQFETMLGKQDQRAIREAAAALTAALNDVEGERYL